MYFWKKKTLAGPTEIWTRIAGFRVQSANHYTMGPWYIGSLKTVRKIKVYISYLFQPNIQKYNKFTVL